MHYLLAACLAAAISAAECNLLTRVDVVPQQPVATEQEFEKLSLDELIDRLPPAGNEWRWDNVLRNVVEHPASEEMRCRLLNGNVLSDDQWQRVLLGTGAIRYRQRWPKDEPYALSLTVPRWLDLTQMRLTARGLDLPQEKAGETVVQSCGTCHLAQLRYERLRMPRRILPEGTTEIIFDVEVERGKMNWSRHQNVPPKPGMLWEGSITLPVELVDSVQEMTKAIDDDSVRAAVRDAVGAGFRSWGNEGEVPFVVIDPDCDRFPILKTTGLIIRVELLQDGAIIAESWLVAGDSDTLSLANSIRNSATRFYGSANLRIENVDANPSKWLLRLTGTNDFIQHLWHAESHWSGELTIPWAEAVEHEKQRTADHGRGPEVSTPRYR